MANSPDTIMRDVNNRRTPTFQSINTQPERHANNAMVPTYPWTNDTDSGDMPAGLYQLSPMTGDEPVYNIVLYIEAFSFYDLYGFQDARDEITKITDCFAKVVPQVFPDASVQLLWSRTMSDFNPDLERKIKEYISAKPSVYIIMSPNYFAQEWFKQWFVHDSALRQEIVQQARAVFFIMTLHPKLLEVVSSIVKITLNKNVNQRPTITFSAFNWDKEFNDETIPKLKVIKMPSPSVSQTPSRSSSGLSQRSSFFGVPRGNTMDRSVGAPFPKPNYSWLGHVLSPMSITPPNLSPTNDEWMINSANLFSNHLRKTENMILGRGFSLWFLITRLKTVNLGFSANVGFLSHWGILISKATKWEMEHLIASSTNPMEPLGNVHELRNEGFTEYKIRTFTMNDYRVASKFDYIGQTELDINTIMDIGFELLAGDARYNAITNNCQGWVKNFLRKVCPDHGIKDKTIEEILQTTTLRRSQTLEI